MTPMRYIDSKQKQQKLHQESELRRSTQQVSLLALALERLPKSTPALPTTQNGRSLAFASAVNQSLSKARSSTSTTTMARVVIHQRGVRWQCNDSTDSDLFITEYCGTDIFSWIHSEQANATLFSPIKIEELYVDKRITARNFRAIFIHTCTLLGVVRREARLERGGGFKG